MRVKLRVYKGESCNEERAGRIAQTQNQTLDVTLSSANQITLRVSCAGCVEHLSKRLIGHRSELFLDHHIRHICRSAYISVRV